MSARNRLVRGFEPSKSHEARETEALLPVRLQYGKCQMLDLRAQQRTSAGYRFYFVSAQQNAKSIRYYRTALGEFGFALVILKFFEARFVTIGLLYSVFALLLLALGWLRSYASREEFQRSNATVFQTSGNVVALSSKIC